jgi:hypothetical protein
MPERKRAKRRLCDHAITGSAKILSLCCQSIKNNILAGSLRAQEDSKRLLIERVCRQKNSNPLAVAVHPLKPDTDALKKARCHTLQLPRVRSVGTDRSSKHLGGNAGNHSHEASFTYSSHFRPHPTKKLFILPLHTVKRGTSPFISPISDAGQHQSAGSGPQQLTRHAAGGR